MLRLFVVCHFSRALWVEIMVFAALASGITMLMKSENVFVTSVIA